MTRHQLIEQMFEIATGVKFDERFDATNAKAMHELLLAYEDKHGIIYPKGVPLHFSKDENGKIIVKE